MENESKESTRSTKTGSRDRYTNAGSVVRGDPGHVTGGIDGERGVKRRGVGGGERHCRFLQRSVINYRDPPLR